MSDFSLGLGELDWVFLVIVLLSTLLGVSRGMIRELFALVGWVAAFFVSLYFATDLAAILPMKEHLGLMVRTLIAVILIVVGCVFAAGLIGKIIRRFLSSISIGAEDSFLGCLFGFLRGILIVGILVFFASMSQFLTRQPWWQNSELIPYVEKGIDVCSPYIPQALLDMRNNSSKGTKH